MDTPTQRVKLEFERFKAALPELLKTHSGKWVVFLNGEVQSMFDDEGSAFDHAVKTLGVEAGFVVAPVVPIAPQPITAAAAFLQ